MPTATPSPHRFLAPRLPSNQKPKAKLLSNLNHGINADASTLSPSIPRERIAAAGPGVTPDRRFAFAPTRTQPDESSRRTIGQTTERIPETTRRPKPSLALRRVESIDEGSDTSSSSSPIHTRLSATVAQSTEHNYTSDGEDPAVEDGDPDDEILFLTQNPNKRRRLTPQPPSPCQPQPEISNAQVCVSTPGPTLRTSSHRFLRNPLQTPAPQPRAQATHTSNPTPAPQRPHFILPTPEKSPSKSTSTTAPSAESFSPSRKGQKFVPDGLASTLQSWVVETSQSSYQAQIKHTLAWGRDKDDGIRMKLYLETLRSGDSRIMGERNNEGVNCKPGGVVFAQGSVENIFPNSIEGQQTRSNVLLAGQGGMTGSARVKLTEEQTVGIRAPTWDVLVGGEKWMVCVDWVVL